MRRPLKITLLSLLGVFAFFLVSIIAVLTWIITSPESAWKFADKYLLPEDLEIAWQEIDFKRERQTWRQWELNWQIRELTLKKTAPFIDVGVTEAEVNFAFNIWTNKPWFDFRTLRVILRDPSTVQLPPSEESTEEFSLYQQAQNYLQYLSKSNRLTAIDVLDVQVPRFELRQAEGAPIILKLNAVKPLAENKATQVGVRAAVDIGTLNIQLDGVLESSNMDSDQAFITAQITAAEKIWSVRSDISGTSNGGITKLNGTAVIAYQYEKKKITASPAFTLTLQESGAGLTATMPLADLPGPIVNLDKVSIQAEIPFTTGRAWSEKPAEFQVESLVDLFLIDKNMRPPIEKACRCRLPERFLVKVDGKAWLDEFFNPTDGKQKILDATAKIENVQNKLFSADVAAGSMLSRHKQEWLIEPRVDAEITIHSFQGVRQFLDAKNIMIPAPFDILEGTVKLTAKSPVARDTDSMKTNAQVLMDLSSPTQKVRINTDIGIVMANTMKSIDLDVDALIRMFKVELPPIDPVLGMPAMAADSRVLKKQPAPKSSASGFKLRVATRVRTEKPGAIQLLSKYAKPHIPVTLELNAPDLTKTSGLVRLEPFRISYLRREIFVEKMTIAVKEAAPKQDPEYPVDGRFRIEQGGYKIFISVVGTLQSPSVLLDSDPYLSRADIISVLLYGRVSDQLISGDAETAGSVDNAIADKAIGLFGLWAFASTPIQSFSYNPVTKVYTATVKLGEGLTAGVGTNWEQAAHLEVRKRLSRQWVLTVSWAPSAGTQTQQEGKLVLQWERRF